MRRSCNGCRVLRKGCSESCILRRCLHWIRAPESQANATIFLAKYYGRAGLLNLISSGPEHLRPDIFRSLLYEACGRILNPVYGSLGLVWSGNWAECQAGVDSILRGSFPEFKRGDSASHIVQARAGDSRTGGRWKGISPAKHKRKGSERAAISIHTDLSSKSDDWGDLTNAFEKVDNGKLHEKYSTLMPEQEPQEFVAAHSRMECCQALCNLKTSQSDAPDNVLELKLTLGSQGCSPRTPDKISAGNFRWSETHNSDIAVNNSAFLPKCVDMADSQLLDV